MHDVHEQLAIYVNLPIIDGDDSRVPVLVMWRGDDECIPYPLLEDENPLIAASMVLMALMIEQVQLTAVCLLTEAWSVDADDSGLSPRERATLGDPSVHTSLTAWYISPDSSRHVFLKEHIEDDGSKRYEELFDVEKADAMSEDAKDFQIVSRLALLNA